MNASQKLGLFILIVISIAYVYFSFFNSDFKFPKFNNKQDETTEYNPLKETPSIEPKDSKTENSATEKVVKIFLLDNSGNLHALSRTCDTSSQKSCFEHAIKELVSAPTKWEKSKGYTSEIPTGTRVLSVRESANSILVDLSSEFESGGGAESTYARVKQIIKTANANSSIPVYLYINGKQANVIGGEGIMIKQPLNERSFDE